MLFDAGIPHDYCFATGSRELVTINGGNRTIQGSPPAAADAGRVKPASTFENAIWRAAASPNEGKVAPTGRFRRTMAKYRAAPGIQLANAGHRHRGAASKNAAAGQGAHRETNRTGRPAPSSRRNHAPLATKKLS